VATQEPTVISLPLILVTNLVSLKSSQALRVSLEESPIEMFSQCITRKLLWLFSSFGHFYL
jgi:hypothetical protein